MYRFIAPGFSSFTLLTNIYVPTMCQALSDNDSNFSPSFAAAEHALPLNLLQVASLTRCAPALLTPLSPQGDSFHLWVNNARPKFQPWAPVAHLLSPHPDVLAAAPEGCPDRPATFSFCLGSCSLPCPLVSPDGSPHANPPRLSPAATLVRAFPTLALSHRLLCQITLPEAGPPFSLCFP